MSDIRMQIKAELDKSSINEIRNQINNVGKVEKLKMNVDSSALANELGNSWKQGKRKIEGDKIKAQVDTTSFNKNLKEATSQMQGLYDKSKVTSVSMKDMGNGMYDVKTKIQDVDGTMKTVVHSFDSGKQALDKQAISIDGVNKGLQKSGDLTELQATNLLKVQKFERDINKLKEDSRKLDPKSEKYQEVSNKIQELEGKTKEWNKSLDNVSNTDFKTMKASINDTKESMKQNIEIEKAHGQALKENAKIDREIAKERAKLAKQSQTDWKQVGSNVSEAGTSIMKLTAPLVAVAGVSVKSAMTFESAFAGVNFLPSMLEII